MMLKKQWYDKLENAFRDKAIDFNVGKAKRDLKFLDSQMQSHYLNKCKIIYQITFVIQRKVITTNGIILNTVTNVNKRLLFVKIGSNDYTNNTPLSKYHVKKFREYLTMSMFKYLNNNKVTYRNYKNLTEGQDRIFLEIETSHELEKAESILNKFFKIRKEKKTKYAKRKFGNEENVLNIRDIWTAEMSALELEHLINKLNHLKHDTSNQILTPEDLISY